MSTSGVTGYTVTAEQIITRALQDLGVLPVGQTVSATDSPDCLLALNLIVKNLMVEGMQLWTYQNVSFPCQTSKINYTIGPSGADITANRPIKVVQAWVKDNSTYPNDRPLNILARQDYDVLTPKTTPGVPVSLYYDPQITTGVVYIWPAPQDATLTVYMLCQRPIEDLSNVLNNFDFPQEYFQPLRYLLASDLGPSYGAPERVQSRIDRLADYYRTRVADQQMAEEPSTTFVPSFQMTMGYGNGSTNP